MITNQKTNIWHSSFFFEQFVLAWIKNSGDEALSLLEYYPDILVSSIALVIVIFCTGQLLFYHISLLKSGSTTNEDMKNMHRKGNVYRYPKRPKNCQCQPMCKSWPASSVRYAFVHHYMDNTLTLRPLASSSIPNRQI